MSGEAALVLNNTVEKTSPRRARMTLLRRLIDVVAMPSSRIPPHDRSMAGDVLLEMLFDADDRERAFCAKRLVPTHEAPRRVLRYLAQCRVEVCQELLEQNDSLDESDLNYILKRTTPAHAECIARRKTLGPAVCDGLVEVGHAPAIMLMLANRRSFLSETAMDALLEASQGYPDYCSFLVERPEMKPHHAMTMFWWSNALIREQILMRFSADRSELIDICGDVFAMAAEENWADPVARKTLQLIERRQRNRAAIQRSPFESLEDAITTAEKAGLDRVVAQEIGYLGGVKPITVAKILTDPGGEALAVFCKSTGLKRSYVGSLWTALKRPLKTETGKSHPDFERVMKTFEMMSVAKAQSTLRYWNWSLSSSFHQRETTASSSSDENNEFSSSRRAARLVFGNE